MILRKRMSQFLYSQDLSNCTTAVESVCAQHGFLYSQDLSNCTTVFDYDTA